MKKYLQRFRQKALAGTTLVEMVVTLLVFGILMSMVVAVLHPATKIFIRMQKLQYAQVILDNTIQELRGMVLEASGDGYVKVYARCEVGGTGDATDLTSGSSSANGYDIRDSLVNQPTGRALEFVNLDGYAVLISADGIPDTDIYMGTENISSEDAIDKGRLAVRYYVRNTNGKYNYKRGEIPNRSYVARAVTPVFADGWKNGNAGPVTGYYMGNYLELEFSYPDTFEIVRDADGNPILDANGNQQEYYSYLNVKVSLYSAPERKPEHLVAQDTAVLDFRYPIKRLAGTVTAQVMPETSPSP